MMVTHENNITVMADWWRFCRRYIRAVRQPGILPPGARSNAKCGVVLSGSVCAGVRVASKNGDQVMKKFDVKAARRGEKVVQGNSSAALYVGELNMVETYYPLIFQTIVDGCWCMASYTLDGKIKGESNPDLRDLFMATTSQQLWVQTYTRQDGTLGIISAYTLQSLLVSRQRVLRNYLGEPVKIAEVETQPPSTVHVESVISQRQRDILRHALGLPKNYRNYFCTGEGSNDFQSCEDLVAAGMMERCESSRMSNHFYRVTEQGRKVAG